EREHADHSGTLQRARGVDGADASVGVWAAEDSGVQQTRQRDVADVAAAAPHQTRILLAEEPVADELHRIARPGPGADARTWGWRRTTGPSACGSSSRIRERRASRPRGCCRPGPPRTRSGR